MRIQGAGGVQDNRIYEVEFKDAWRLIFDCLNDIGIDIDERDETNFVIHAHKGKKFFDSCILTSIKSILKSIPGVRTTVMWMRFTSCMNNV